MSCSKSLDFQLLSSPHLLSAAALLPPSEWLFSKPFVCYTWDESDDDEDGDGDRGCLLGKGYLPAESWNKELDPDRWLLVKFYICRSHASNMAFLCSIVRKYENFYKIRSKNNSKVLSFKQSISVKLRAKSCLYPFHWARWKKCLPFRLLQN